MSSTPPARHLTALMLLCLLTATIQPGLAETRHRGDTSKFEYRPDALQPGTVLVYLKSNLDGSNPSHLAILVREPNLLEAFKWHEGDAEGALVKATMDWTTFSVRTFEAGRIDAQGTRTVGAKLSTPGEVPEEVLISLGSGNFTASIGHWPWHSYDFDFTSLNVTLRFLRDPEAPFTIGIADFVPAEGRFRDKGPVTVEYLGRETWADRDCRKYSIDGPGLEHRGGFIWVDTESGFVAGYEIDLPDEDSYTSGRLELQSIDRLDPDRWSDFIDARLDG